MRLCFLFSLSLPFLVVFLFLLIVLPCFHLFALSLSFCAPPLLPLFDVVWHHVPASFLGSISPPPDSPLSLILLGFLLPLANTLASMPSSFFQHLYCVFATPAFAAALSRMLPILSRNRSPSPCPVSLSSTSVISFSYFPLICISYSAYLDGAQCGECSFLAWVDLRDGDYSAVYFSSISASFASLP